MVFSLRQAMTRFLEEQSTGDVRAVLKAIVVGDCGEITPALNKSYANSGLIHMLSASGQHVAIVAAMTLMLTMMLARATPRLLLYFPLKKVAATASIPAMVIYCLLVGARAPAIRSTIMGLVVASAILLERKWHSLNSLALAGLIILLIYPLSLFTPSFQLSFAAVFGILFVVPQLAGRLFGRELETEPGENAHKTKMAIKGSTSTLSRWLRYVVVLIFTSLAATAAITPIILSLFHYFPVYTVLANLIADPVLAVALPMALGASIIGTIFPSLGALVLMPAAVLIGIINRLAETFSSLPGSTITAKHMEGMQFVLLTVLAFGFMWFLRGAHWRASRAIAVASVLTAACLISWPLVRSEERDLTVTFLNVGKADAMFVKPHGSNGLLIDGGSRTPEFDAGRSILLPFLQWYGARRIDCMVISHPDSDHLGGLLSVMTEVPPARLWWNEVDSNSSLLKEILCAVRSSGIPVLQADRFCSPVRLGKAELRFLNPPAKLPGGAARFRGTNDASIVCRLDYGETSFLFTGDAERPAESELLDAGAALRATVLKVAHHGCKTSSSWAFLEAVRPRYAVISCDDYPESKCPDPKVLERLKLIGAEILWTGKDGAVIFSTDGKKLVVKTGRNRKPM
jgi:competence protein ComEC